MFRRSSSILRMTASMLRPIQSEISPGRRMSTCDAGRNTGTPMSTSRPPLIFFVTLPETGSPSFLVFMMASQLMIRSALRLLIFTNPVSPSTSSSRTLTSSPILTSFGSSNSPRSRMPSLLRPSSTTQSSPAVPLMRPLMIDPGLKTVTSSPGISSPRSSALVPRASRTATSMSSSKSVRPLIRLKSTMRMKRGGVTRPTYCCVAQGGRHRPPRGARASCTHGCAGRNARDGGRGMVGERPRGHKRPERCGQVGGVGDLTAQPVSADEAPTSSPSLDDGDDPIVRLDEAVLGFERWRKRTLGGS